ncbi:MAG: TolA-binding protein [Bacteroidia bacterium]|jgi:TolA-binding protein|tara:strand:+ start:597 stop:1184 length:588 start_codon:yes stop_codon:yes gene_type:complete
MKNIVLTVLSIVFVFSISTAEAQSLSKKERRALKKEIKTYKKNPEKWVKMQNQHIAQITELSGEVATLNAKLAEIEKLRAEKMDLADKLAALEAQYAKLKRSMPSTQVPMGIVYQVQMGYYQYLDLVSFNEKLKTIKAEEVDGAKRYVIGHFENVMDAIQFSNDIKKLGIKDAFVSQYEDGVRNMTFDALEEISQ